MKRCLVLALLVASHAQAAERSAPRPLCTEDFPDGVHLAPQTGCDARPRRQSVRDDGFRDFGDGVSVRVNGRAGATFGTRR